MEKKQWGVSALDIDSSNLSHVWLMLLLPAVLLAFIIVAYAGFSQLDLTDPSSETVISSALPYLIAINHTVVFAVLLWLLRRRKEPLSSIGWDWEVLSSTWLREILIGAAAALVLYLFKETVIDSIRALLAGNRPTFTTLFNLKPGEIYTPMAVAATLLVFVEESVYRGFAIPRLGKRFGIYLAVLISTLFFALLHWGNGPFALLSSFLLGLLMALIFLWRGNLLAGTIAHAGANLLMLAT